MRFTNGGAAKDNELGSISTGAQKRIGAREQGFTFGPEGTAQSHCVEAGA